MPRSLGGGTSIGLVLIARKTEIINSCLMVNTIPKCNYYLWVVATEKLSD